MHYIINHLKSWLLIVNVSLHIRPLALPKSDETVLGGKEPRDQRIRSSTISLLEAQGVILSLCLFGIQWHWSERPHRRRWYNQPKAWSRFCPRTQVIYNVHPHSQSFFRSRISNPITLCAPTHSQFFRMMVSRRDIIICTIFPVKWPTGSDYSECFPEVNCSGKWPHVHGLRMPIISLVSLIMDHSFIFFFIIIVIHPSSFSSVEHAKVALLTRFGRFREDCPASNQFISIMVGSPPWSEADWSKTGRTCPSPL